MLAGYSGQEPPNTALHWTAYSSGCASASDSQ
jgi:hypothetical protein